MTHNYPRRVDTAIQEGTKKFAPIKVPVLAICAHPQDLSAALRSLTNQDQRAKMDAFQVEMDAKGGEADCSFSEGGSRRSCGGVTQGAPLCLSVE
jgi:hypothetical protein